MAAQKTYDAETLKLAQEKLAIKKDLDPAFYPELTNIVSFPVKWTIVK